MFTGASLLCALAQSQGLLIGARFVQGVGGALTSAVILGMIVTMFPEPREQAKAIGVYTFVAVAGGSIGLLLGGVLTQTINWHWIFFVNLPIGMATALLRSGSYPIARASGLTAGADLPGAALLTGGLMLGVYTILGVAEEGWGSSQTLALGALSIALLAAFVLRQARVANPLMPLRLFRSRNVAGANSSRPCSWSGCSGCSSWGPLHAADPRLRRAPGRPRLPAPDRGHGHDVVPLHRPAQPQVRAAGDAHPRRWSSSSPGCCSWRARRSTPAMSSTCCRRWS